MQNIYIFVLPIVKYLKPIRYTCFVVVFIWSDLHFCCICDMLIVYIGVFVCGILCKINVLQFFIKADCMWRGFSPGCWFCMWCVLALLICGNLLSFCFVYKCFNNVNCCVIIGFVCDLLIL